MTKKRLLAVIPIAVACAACSGEQSNFPEVEGWAQTSETLIYDVDNLWEYINGAAELFVEYDVQTCRTADLSSGDLTATVDLYDMGTPLNAFGIYNRESSGEGDVFPSAVEAVVSPPYQALLLKGATYVKVNAVEGELTESSGRELLDAIARALPGETAYPAELELLPENGKVAGSEGYQRRGFLGLTELTRCVYAEYTDGGDETWQGFVMLADAEGGATSTWDMLAEEWDLLEHRGQQVLYKEIPYVGLVGVVQTESGIVGASGAADQDQMLSRLDGLIS
jgi:hypothetical protein